MSEQFHVVFSGRIIEHADLEMVKHNVGRAFKLQPEQVDKLFSGKRIALKKNVDAATAEKIRSTLQRAGALCEVIDAQASARPAEAPARPGSMAGDAQQASTQPAAPPPAPADDSGMTLAEVGVTIVESKPVMEAHIDTSGMDMAEVGVTIVEPKPVEEAHIDTSGMDMAEVGVTIVEPKPVEEAHIDTSAFQLVDDLSRSDG